MTARRLKSRTTGVHWWTLLGTVPIGAQIAGLLASTALSGRRVPRPGAGALVVLGSGLEGDAVSLVLAGRLECAAALFRAGSAAGRPPLVVLSGGAKAPGGATEAAAMAAYLRGLGVPEDRLVVEDRSITTRENLLYSAARLAQRAVPPGIVAVTSDFHVWRTATLARLLGLRVRVVGAPTPVSLRIPAMLRELRLVLGQHAWSTAAGCAALIAAVAGPAQWLTRAGGRPTRSRAGRRGAGRPR